MAAVALVLWQQQLSVPLEVVRPNAGGGSVAAVDPVDGQQAESGATTEPMRIDEPQGAADPVFGEESRAAGTAEGVERAPQTRTEDARERLQSLPEVGESGGKHESKSKDDRGKKEADTFHPFAPPAVSQPGIAKVEHDLAAGVAEEAERAPAAPSAPTSRQSVGSALDQPAVDDESGRTRPEQVPIPKPMPGRDRPISVGGTDPVNGRALDAMFFEHYGVNPFVDPLDDRLATFAVDVDNASYTLARSYLQRGALPPKDAVRVEEFVNAFRHDYAPPLTGVVADRRQPVQRETFAIHLDAAPSPFGKDLVLLRVGIKGREVEPWDRKPAVLTFVVDVSGSMEREDRLELVKRSLLLLLDQMRPEDRVALVVYGTSARTILPHTAVRDRAAIERAVFALRPEGSTNAEAGLREAYALASRGFERGAINRVILCSDGVANVGRTGAEDILNVIKREAAAGIELTTVGVGMGNYNDVLMEKLADHGDGNYFYVDDITEARRVFVDHLTGTLQTIARQTKIQVEFDPDQVRRYRLLGYENRDVADRDFRNDSVDAGEVGAGHEVTALFEVRLAQKPRSGSTVAMVRIRYESPETGRVTEESRAVKLDEIATRFAHADPSLKLDAAVAEFAEILRHSYWAKDSSLREVAALAREASRELGRPAEAEELVTLVETAGRLWPTDETWKYTVRPQWEPED
jgi:Ca-activated chloride channel family protein